MLVHPEVRQGESPTAVPGAPAAIALAPQGSSPPIGPPGFALASVCSQESWSPRGTDSELFLVSLSATDCYIVHEIYNGENAQDQFEYELEQALEAQYKYIVIEPTRIGDETARWITVGNCLHKTTVLAGTACLFTPLALPLDYSHYISLPAGVLSLACCTLYGISWQFDPCCKYQVEYDAYRLSRLPLHTLTSSTPVVLVRKDDLHRKRLHNTIALAALVYCVKKIYELCAV
uniref:Transmembrane protein 11 n=1 Tax=Capra hircus TaxID=9925 RepID=A0A8C2P8V4_CAPHI